MTRSVRIFVSSLPLWCLLLLPAPGFGQARPTIARPVVISLAPVDSVLHPGQQSNLLLRFRIPAGFRIGDAASAVRMPAPTLVEPVKSACLDFGPAQFPEPVVQGVPVRLGTTSVFEGDVRALIPFEVRSNCGPGPQEVTVRLTYTPAVTAGQLSTHAREPYRTSVRVAAPSEVASKTQPARARMTAIDEHFIVDEPPSHLPGPVALMRCSSILHVTASISRCCPIPTTPPAGIAASA